jgi:hypothetical protein
MRKAGGSVKPTQNGGFLHRLNDFSHRQNFTRPPVPAARVTPIAEIEHCDGIYAALVRSHLTLATEHKQNLLARGMSEAEIERNGYASLPRAAHGTSVANALSHLGLEGVPGFYRTSGKWLMNTTAGAGFLVPVRDCRARIQAFQIRRDKGEPRYIWLSSAGKSGGTSSGAPVHFANAHLLARAAEVTVTEGALKADIAAYLSHAPVIGVAGVNSFGADFSTRLRESFPNLARVRVAYDRDLLEKPPVYEALKRLTAQLERARFSVRVRTWPPPSKGYDDFLLSQSMVQGVAA